MRGSEGKGRRSESEEVRSPSENPHEMALSSGGESAPLIRARSVVRVHEGPPPATYARPRYFGGSFVIFDPSSVRLYMRPF